VLLFDAHNHFQDERLDPWRDGMAVEMPQLGLAEMVVNGSCAEDWPQVAELAGRYPWVRPAFGLHPWCVKQRAGDWQEVLAGWWERFPEAVVGEIGLDRWIAEPDIEAQRECFLWQWDWAARHERVTTIHCLRAFGMLRELLVAGPVPPRGFLLHSYGGPVEMVREWVRLGGYFSVSPYFFHERKRVQLETFRTVPLERLLIETDAPDMRPPAALNPNPLVLESGEEVNHPANLSFCYERVAELRGMTVEALAAQVALNYRCLFG
jgi:TatD DNase family protein